MLDLITLPYARPRWSGLLRQMFAQYEERTVPLAIPIPEGGLAVAIHQLGVVTLPRDAGGESVTLAVIEIVASDAVALLRNRVGIRNLAASLLSPGTADGLLVATTQPGNDAWRFTFVHRETRFDEDGSLVHHETPTRRYTYVLGPNESCRTPDTRFQLLARHLGSTTLAHVLDAFSVEKLSIEFFTTYKAHYRGFCDHLTENTDLGRSLGIHLENLVGKDRARALKPMRDFVKKLLGRLVFLHFIQKKGWLGCPALSGDDTQLPQESMAWVGGSPDFLRLMFQDTSQEEQARFHSTRLVPLFFHTLNQPQRPGLIFAITGTRVPYLNGGLFEPDFPGVEDVDFPAPLFAALLEFFTQYHFTIDENDPEDHEIGIDPEMLGRIFENLLEDNKDKGAYYTPKPVVQYMCQQSLIHALTGRYPGDPDAPAEIGRLVRLKEPINARQDSWLARHATGLTEYLDDLRICDPAIGSGAFPIGLLQEIYWTKLTLNPSLDRATAKRAIIQHCIHGVDLDAGAVEIARLRFWLALIVDESVPTPLPNLDYQIMQGNSLLESFEGEPLDQLAEPVRAVGRQRLGSSDMELDFGGNAAPGEFVVMIQSPERYQLSELREAYYACHDPAEKADIRARIDAAILHAIDARFTHRREELEGTIQNWDRELARKRRLNPSYLRKQGPKSSHAAEERELKKRAAMQAELDALTGKSERLHALLSNPRSERPFFLWHLWFRQILAAAPEGRDGFDIVIGNPPYVRADNPDFLPHRAAILAEKRGSAPAFVTLWEKWDLYMPFIEHGHTLLRPGGVETMIVSDAYCHSKYAIKSQEWFLRNAVIHRLDFLGKLQIFDAGVKNMIFFYGSGDGSQKVPERRLHSLQFGTISLLPSESQYSATHRLFFPGGDTAGSLSIRTETVMLGDIAYISVGMVVHADEKVAKGAFELHDLVSDYCDDLHPRAFVEGKHLARWQASNNKWLEWGTSRAPLLFRRPTFSGLYTAPKIFIHRTGGEGIRACIDTNGTLCNHTVMVCMPWSSLAGVRNKSLRKSAIYPDERKANNAEKPDRIQYEERSAGYDLKFLLGISNSSFARHYLRADRRSNTDLFPDDWKSLPIPVISAIEQAPVVALVDRILTAKRAGDDAAVGELEAEIDAHVFRLYGLTPEEINLVRGAGQ